MFRTLAPVTGCRPGWIALALLVGPLAAAPVHAQAPPAQAPPAQAPAAPAQAAKPVSNPRLFPNDGGLWLNFIKPDKTADFEMVMEKVKEALQKSDKPERKEQAASWKFFKSPEPAGANALYVFFIHPASKTADYQISNIIAEGFPVAEANEILKKYSEAYANPAMNIVNLTMVQDLSK
jgi:hypothetical protein